MRLRRAVIGTASALALLVGGVAAAHVAGATSARTVREGFGPRRPNVQASCARSTTPGAASCFALRRTDVAPHAALAPNATPAGYGPADLQSAYKLPAGAGAGATVAIIDAFDDPTAESDLATYRAQFGLPPCTTANGCFRKINQNGQPSPLPTTNAGWAGEISLDVDMVSAVCPQCHILLVEANSNGIDLYTAINQAVAQGARFISNSWGGSEFSGQTTIEQQYLNHPGVVITVSSGDDGTGSEFPSSSRFVTSVGGTTLTRSANSRGWTESAWAGAGSGCSAFDTKATWQTVTTACARRASADVSAVADPATGVAVYQTFGGSGWMVYGGTSASAPIIASVYALAGTPGAVDYPAAYPYAAPGNLFDVTSGSNGACGGPMCDAGTGWDGPTGLGTPNGVGAFTSGAPRRPAPPPGGSLPPRRPWS
jgi:subtilase family serine protease